MLEKPKLDSEEVPIPEHADPASVYGPHPPSIKEYNEVYERSRHDQMTGLLNQEAFKEDVVRRIQAAEEERAKPALIYIDLDEFKLINDVHGHEMGDKIIKAVAATLRHKEAGAPDFGGRLGGDEFGFLVDLAPREENPQTEEERLEAIVGRIRGNFAALLQTKEFAELAKVGAGISMGSEVWHPGMSAQNLIDAADRKMYEQKKAVKNQPRMGSEQG